MECNQINYYALTVSIMTNATPEIAFAKMYGEKEVRTTKQDAEDMVKFKASGMTYQEIADMYGITESAAWRRIKRHNGGEICS